jgi:hypothetical protein
LERTIKADLAEIEARENVRIVYACESGSRAWGFPSSDSDYDVRFIYLHPRAWYLSIENKRDVIEHPITGRLDINGWDLRKALQLFQKSNPPLFEWLNSPIVYLEKYSVISRLRILLAEYYSPKACAYHYLHMAHGNFRGYLQGDQVWVKKYFYALRPVLVVNWIEQGLGVVPTEFGVLVDRIVKSPGLKTEITKLVEAKRRGDELDHGPRIAAISEFIETELHRYQNHRFSYAVPAAPAGRLDELFNASLQEVWGSDPTGVRF